MDFIYCIDVIGTFVFAISGVLAAIDKKLDVVGSIVIGFVTALGGGTLRDVLIGKTPVGWMGDTNYLLIVLAALPVCYYFKKYVMKARKSLFIFDTIGIGLFTIFGVEKALSIGLSTPICVMMGIVSAVFGGVIRDIILNEIPLIFRKEIYASACFVGAVVYVTLGMFDLSQQVSMLISIGLVILIRYFSVKKQWELPFKPK